MLKPIDYSTKRKLENNSDIDILSKIHDTARVFTGLGFHLIITISTILGQRTIGEKNYYLDCMNLVNTFLIE
jgi:hypothetical protein